VSLPVSCFIHPAGLPINTPWLNVLRRPVECAQFGSDEFTGVLKREHITISMDGRCRAYDNIFVERLWRSVKHEDVYLHGYSGVGELLIGLTKYFAFYNAERAHQSLENQTPQHVHETSSGGGAMIVNKYRTKERSPVALRSSGTAFEEVRNDI
jgi:putative transposase